MTNAAQLATRYARRPLLLEPSAAREILRHISAQDPRGMRSEGRVEAFMRRLMGSTSRRPAAMEDGDYDGDASAARTPDAYAPLWAQQAYGDPADEGFAWSLYEGVAMMEVNTAIGARGEYYCGEWYHGYDTILAAMREAIDDSRVGGLFLRLSSPGGVVDDGLYELAAFIRQSRAQAGGKPIYVHADMAASAAYWIAAQADRITAGPVGLVGSIGAILVHADYSQADQKAGVVVTPIQFGAEKSAGADWAPLSLNAHEDLQAEIDQCGNDFVADVTAGRPKLTSEALIDTQARVYMARHADPTRSGLDLGFIDAILTEQEAFQALLDKVSAPKAGSRSRAAAKGSHGAPNAQQETPPMALHPVRGAKAPKNHAHASSDVAPVSDGGLEDCETCNGSGEVDGDDCPDCNGTGQVAAAAPEPDQADAAAASAPRRAASASVAIADSAEAKTHPHMALAAIKSGQTLAQFQANVGAAGSAPKTGRLDAAMEGARRLGSDAPVATASKPISAADIYAKRAEATRKR